MGVLRGGGARSPAGRTIKVALSPKALAAVGGGGGFLKLRVVVVRANRGLINGLRTNEMSV